MFYTSHFQIGFAHIGFGNLITNSGILSILEETAGSHSSSIGCGLNDIPETHISWAILNWKVKVFKRPKYLDKVIVKTWAREKNKIFSFHFIPPRKAFSYFRFQPFSLGLSFVQIVLIIY